MNYFEVLLIQPPKLLLSSQELEKTYYALSMKTHPDLQGASPEVTEASSNLNQAYRTLRNPWQRALYFLQLKEISINDSKMPQKLAEVFFEIEDSDDKDALKKLHSDLQEKIAQMEIRLLDLFQKIDENSNQLELLRDIVVERKYILSMIENLENRLHVN